MNSFIKPFWNLLASLRKITNDIIIILYCMHWYNYMLQCIIIKSILLIVNPCCMVNVHSYS